MFAKIRQKIPYRKILYRLMVLEYKRDAGRLTEEELEKKWPIVDRTEWPQYKNQTTEV
jgi:hypothetical protein